MQSIVTKYLGPTNTRGSRVVAQTSGYHHFKGDRSKFRLVLSWNHSLNSESNHSAAAKMLAERLEWDGKWIAGESPDTTGYVFVYATTADSFSVQTEEQAA